MPRGGMDPEIALLSEEERLDPDDARELLDLDGERLSMGPNDIIVALVGVTNSGKTTLHRALGRHTFGVVSQYANQTLVPVIKSLCNLEAGGISGKVILMDLPGLAGPDEAATIERNIWDRIVPIVDFIVYVVQASTMTDQQSLTNYEKCLRILHGVRDPNRVIVVGNRADSLNTRQLQQVNADAKRLYRKDEILFTCSAAALAGQHDWDAEELADTRRQWDRKCNVCPDIAVGCDVLRTKVLDVSRERFFALALDTAQQQSRLKTWVNWTTTGLMSGFTTAMAALLTWIPGLAGWGAIAGPVLFTTAVGAVALVPVAITMTAGAIPLITYKLIVWNKEQKSRQLQEAVQRLRTRRARNAAN